MGQLTNLYVSQSYQGLIKLANSTTGVTGTLQYTQDGLGNNLPLQISTSSVNITGSFTVNGLPVQANVDTGSLVTTASFNAFTSSIDGRVDALEVETGSLQNQINQKLDTGSFNSYTSSNDNKVNSLINATGSYATTSSLAALSQSIALTDLSQNNRLTSIESITGSLATTSSLTSLSQSIATTDLDQNNRLGSLETATGSLQNQINQKLDTGSFNSYSGNTLNLINTKLDSSSFNSYTSSNDGKVNSLISKTGSYATTGSNDFVGQQNINGSVNITGSLNVTGEITALSASITYLETIYQTSSVIFSSGSNILGDEVSDTQTLNGDVNVPLGTLRVDNISNWTTGGDLIVASQGGGDLILNGFGPSIKLLNTGSNQFVSIDGNTEVTGTLKVTGGITGSLQGTVTGSLQGTASYATQALSSSWSNVSLSSSFAFQANTASYVLNAVSASFSQNTISGSFSNFAVSSSFSDFAISASQAQNATTASFALNGGVTQLLAGPNITVSPLSGKGQVTISSTGTGTGSFNTATGSYGSFYDTTTQTNHVANTPNSMSFNETSISNGVTISGSLSPYNTYIKTENAGVYNLQFSAQVDKTDGGTDEVFMWISKNGIDLIDSAGKVTLDGGNAAEIVSWNYYVQSAANDYYQLKWSSPDTAMRLLAEPSSSAHPGIPSIIATAERIDQFLSNTGSFNGDFNGSFTGSLQGTASFASNIDKTGLITTGSAAGSQSITGSLILSGSAGPELDVKGDVIITGSIILSGSAGVELDVKGDTNITGSLGIRSGSLSTISQGTTVNINSFLTSSEAGQSNIIKGWGDNFAQGGPSSVLANFTGSVRITGSNNTLSMPQIRATAAVGGDVGMQGYISGSDNMIMANNAGIYLNTGSLLFPKTQNNFLGNGSSITMNFTTSSLAGGPVTITNNIVNGGSIQLNSNSGSFTAVGTNYIGGGSIVSTQNFVTNTRALITQNNILGTVTLNHISSSIAYQANYSSAPMVVNNHLSSSNIALNSLSVANNLFLGGSNGNFAIYASGSQSSNSQRFITDNLIGGRSIIVSSSFISSSNSNLYASLIYGQNLIVSGSHITNGGSAFLGRFNDATSLHLAQDIVFAVGTGTGTSTRRTGLYVTSGSLVGVSGSLQVIGDTTMTGSLTLSGSAGPELLVIGNAIITGSVQGNVLPLTVVSNTASLDLNNGNFFELALTGSSDIRINPSNIKPGQTINIKLNTTGSGTISFPTSVKQPSGSAYVPTTAVGTDILTMMSFDSTNLFVANVKNLI